MRFNPLVWAVGGAAVGLALGALLLILSRLLAAGPEPASPVLTVIPLPSATPIPTAAPADTPAPTPQDTPPPGSAGPRPFGPGQLVSISGTGGEGLRLREAPGLNSPVRWVALENEVFEVIEGPVNADGYHWWRVTNPFDRSQVGWAADQFLQGLDS